MNAITIVYAITIFYMLAGCAKDQHPSKTGSPQLMEITETERDVIKRNKEFGISLLKQVAKKEQDNILISPISMNMALSMMLNGAKGETKGQMTKALKKQGIRNHAINNTHKKLLETLPSIDSNVTNHIANSIWYRHTFSVDQSFIDTTKHYYHSQVIGLDFTSPTAKKTINHWVEQNTGGKITRIIEEIDDQHVMFLINATYFNGKWTNAFDPGKTSPGRFEIADGSNVQVPMMHYEKTNFYYHSTDSIEVAEIPYGNGSYRMTILLPKKGTVDNVIQNMTAQKWKSIVSEGDAAGRRELYLPRFELNSKKEMKEVLMDMGMGVAFDPQRANFEGINQEAGQQLFIDNVKHKVHLKVDEEGTEAAAATSVGVGITSMPPVMRVDRPFVLAIREKETATLLFIGRITNPTT